MHKREETSTQTMSMNKPDKNENKLTSQTLKSKITPPIINDYISKK